MRLPGGLSDIYTVTDQSTYTSSVVPLFHVRLEWHAPSNHMNVEMIYPPEDVNSLSWSDRKHLAMAKAAFEVDLAMLRELVVGERYDRRSQDVIRDWAWRCEKFLQERCFVNAKVEMAAY